MTDMLQQKLPSGWVQTTLTELIDYKGGGQPPKSTFSERQLEGYVRLLQIRDFEHDNYAVYIQDADKWPKCDFNDIMIGRYGASVGKILTGKSGAYNVALVKVIADYSKIERTWLYYFLKSENFQSPLSLLSRSAQNGFNKNDLSSICVCLPPLAEQRRIADKIEELQSKTSTARKALETTRPLLEQYRQSILAAAFRGDLTGKWREQNQEVEPASELLERIRTERRARWEEAELAKMQEKGKKPKNDKWKAKYKEPEPVNTEGLPELPEGWCWGTVAELASDQPRSIQSGPFGSNLKHSEFRKEGVLAIGIDNVRECQFSLGRENRISEEKYTELEKYTARPLDVLITVMATVGRCCVVPQDVEKSIITKHVYRISVEKELYDSFLLMYALVGAETVLSYIEDNTRGQTRAGINGTILKELPVPIPPRDEQDQIVKNLDKQLSSVKDQQVRMDSMLQQLEALDQAVLSKAFRGELVPQDINDEPASVLLEKIAAEQAERKKASKKISRKPRRVKKKVDDKSLLKVINELPTDSFSFDELAAKVNADYEVVKEALFKLLESDSSGLTQIFDKEAEIVKIKKG